MFNNFLSSYSHSKRHKRQANIQELNTIVENATTAPQSTINESNVNANNNNNNVTKQNRQNVCDGNV